MNFLFYNFGDHTSDIHLKKDVYGFSRGFVRAGYQSTMVSGEIRNSPVKGIKYVETHNFHRNMFSILKDFIPFLKILATEDPDVVMFFHNNLLLPITVSFYSILTKFKRGSKSRSKKVIWITKIDFSGERMPFQSRVNYVLEYVGYVVCSFFVSYVVLENTCAQHRFKRFIIGEEKLKVIPISYSIEYFIPVRYEDFSRGKTILCVGRITRELGIMDLLKVFNSLKDEFTEWNVVLVGPTSDNVYLNEIKSYVNNNLNNRVQYNEYIKNEELLDLYRHSSIFCRPSLTYGNEAIRIEAAVNGLPVITSDTGCWEYFSSLGMKTFKRGDPEDLTRILRLLMSNEQLRINISTEQLKNIKPFELLVKDFADEIKREVNWTQYT